MDAGPLLGEVGRRLREASLEAVSIGNAAAALQGAPVTTIDFDFLFRKTPRNLAKLKTIARALGATILRPYSQSISNPGRAEAAAGMHAAACASVSRASKIFEGLPASLGYRNDTELAAKDAAACKAGRPIGDGEK